MQLLSLLWYNLFVMKIILASSSPRRFEILNKHGIDPIVLPTDADESIVGTPTMTEVVEDISHRKALACYENIISDLYLRDKLTGHIIIGADTIVYKDEIFGKPKDESDIRRMLDAYRGTYHYVVTGVTLIDVDSGRAETLSDVTKVWCVEYSDEDIDDYIAHETPYDKSGAYAIQGYFSKYVDFIEGDIENVIGLPYHRIAELLEKYKV